MFSVFSFGLSLCARITKRPKRQLSFRYPSCPRRRQWPTIPQRRHRPRPQSRGKPEQSGSPIHQESIGRREQRSVQCRLSSRNNNRQVPSKWLMWFTRAGPTIPKLPAKPDRAPDQKQTTPIPTTPIPTIPTPTLIQTTMTTPTTTW